MKSNLRILCLLSILLVGTAWGEPSFTKEQIIKLAHVVLSVTENKEYKVHFWDSQPQYDDKTGTWRFIGAVPATPGGALHIFEIRDADGFYRLGWITAEKSSRGFDRFRIQPSTRAKLNELMKTFSQQ